MPSSGDVGELLLVSFVIRGEIRARVFIESRFIYWLGCCLNQAVEILMVLIIAPCFLSAFLAGC